MSKLKLKEKRLRLEEGKRYVRKDGVVTGFLTRFETCYDLFWDQLHGKSYHSDGQYVYGCEFPEDLVAEYTDDIGPQVDRAPFMDQPLHDIYAGLYRPLPDNDEERKAIPIYDGFIKYFPHAIVEVTKVSVAGNNQHNPGEPVHHDPSKSPDELNSMMRHVVDGAVPQESTQELLRTKAQTAWRAMMDLEKTAREAK